MHLISADGHYHDGMYMECIWNVKVIVDGAGCPTQSSTFKPNAPLCVPKVRWHESKRAGSAEELKTGPCPRPQDPEV